MTKTTKPQARTTYVVEYAPKGTDPNTDFDWEPTRDGDCSTIESARAYRKWYMSECAKAYGTTTRIVEVTRKVVR